MEESDYMKQCNAQGQRTQYTRTKIRLPFMIFVFSMLGCTYRLFPQYSPKVVWLVFLKEAGLIGFMSDINFPLLQCIRYKIVIIRTTIFGTCQGGYVKHISVGKIKIHICWTLNGLHISYHRKLPLETSVFRKWKTTLIFFLNGRCNSLHCKWKDTMNQTTNNRT